MNTPLTSANFTRLEACLPHAIPLSTLDGYLAAVASGPSFVMLEQVLRCLWNAGHAGDATMAGMIVRHYSTVNDALNNRVYVPRTTSVQAWCRGYIAGFASDMIAWAPLMAAHSDLLKLILSAAEERPFDGNTETLAVVARRIHEFWAKQLSSVWIPMTY